MVPGPQALKNGWWRISSQVPGIDFNLTSFRSALGLKLPEYMLPAIFVPMQTLPLSPNGKVDRRALPAPGWIALWRITTRCSPRDELEQSLCQVWEALLNIHPVGIHDNFFDLGGHSLLAIRLAGQIEEQFGQRLPIGAIFQSPTVAGLAETLRQVRESRSASC